VYPSADGWGIFFYKYFYKSVAYPIKGITFAYTKTRKDMKNLTALFVELVKIELSSCKRNSKNMVANTIQHFAEMKPFNQISIEQWHCICSANGVKYDL
jgi:hypothetical protein